jgi:predicted SnoaL-like aldol condensation-catalyzing enzyme
MAGAVESNKALVADFLDLAFNQHRPAEAATRYLGQTFRQHDPNLGDGPAPFVAFLTEYARAYPALKMTVRHVVAEGNLVVVHGHLLRKPSDRGLATVHIFRVSEGRIVEHWDAIQEVPPAAANENTMF